MTSLPPLTFSATLRYDLVSRLLHQMHDIDTVLEVGAGVGGTGARLAQSYRYVGVEPDPEACATASKRVAQFGGEVRCGDISAIDPGATFDLVCAFEVLEHIKDDSEALAAWSTHARPGGCVMLSVPPFQRRFGPSDREVGHFRRYEPEQIAALMERCGLRDPKVYLYGFPIGYALDFAKNALTYLAPIRGSRAERTAASGRRFQPRIRTGTAIAAASAPFRILQRPFHSSRMGSGLVAVARKPEPAS